MQYSLNSTRTQPWDALPELPLAPALYETIPVYAQLARSRAALGRLQGRSAVIPNQGLLLNPISLLEAKASSTIENTFTTDDDLYRAFSEQTFRQGETCSGAIKQVLRYREALWHGHDYLRGRADFNQEYFVRVYRQLQPTGDGLRPSPVVKHDGMVSDVGAGTFTPPRGTGSLKDRLANLLTFMNDDERYPLDPLLKMAIGHFQFEAIQPFGEGNGRAGRVFNIHYLTHKGLLAYPILLLSKYIVTYKAEYYATLNGVAQRGDWAAWLLFMLRAIEVTATDTYHKINDIMAAKDAVLRAVLTNTRLEHPEQLVNMLFTQPFTTVKHLTNARLYTESIAHKYLNQLTEIGVLGVRSIDDHQYYINLELHRILNK